MGHSEWMKMLKYKLYIHTHTHTHKGICFSDLRSSIVIHQLASTHCPWCNLTPPPPFFIDLIALASCLHNDAMLGIKTCRAARTCCGGRARWRSQPLNQCAGPGQPAVIWSWYAGVGPLAGCMLGDGARDSASFDPPTRFFSYQNSPVGDEWVCSTETNEYNAGPPSPSHMLFRWMQISLFQWVSEHSLGSIPNLKLCACLRAEPAIPAFRESV